LTQAELTHYRRAWGNLGLTARAAILCGLFFVEKFFLTHFVDLERADAALGSGENFRVAQHFGFRFIVALVAALIVFALLVANPGGPCVRR
jgi:hypothetical protein